MSALVEIAQHVSGRECELVADVIERACEGPKDTQGSPARCLLLSDEGEERGVTFACVGVR